MANKPVYIFGRSFYDIDKVTWSYRRETPQEVAKAINSGYEVDCDKSVRFIDFLINEFYSFGKANTFASHGGSGKRKSITDGIDFYKLRLPARSLPQNRFQKKMMVPVDVSNLADNRCRDGKLGRHLVSSKIYRKIDQTKRTLRKRLAAIR
jgi:hypothetical protein